MEYAALLDQYCPPAIHQNVNTLISGASPEQENLALRRIFGTALSHDCATGVIGQLSGILNARSSDSFKSGYLDIVIYHSENLMTRGNAAQIEQIRQTVASAISGIIDDIRNPQLAGSILAVLGRLRINLLPEIEARVNFRKPGSMSPLLGWAFSEYAMCMKDPHTQQIIADIFVRSDAQTLRRLFSNIRAKLNSKMNCLDHRIIRETVLPYLKDHRTTANVNGLGPPVSHYARRLLDVL